MIQLCFKSLSFTFLLNLINIADSLENGLALTPPMGWLAWERFKCNINCNNEPKNCISEKLFMEMAEILVDEGFRDAGYKYVNIDDCWMSHSRDHKGDMVADPERFPRGIRFLADFMHSRGLKLGIYQTLGKTTCMGYPGIIGHMEQDAKKFAEWKVDMVKLDGCFTNTKELDKGYIKMGQYLNETGRPMLYSCSWPYYQLVDKMEPNYKLIGKHCNIWRNFHDITDSWKTINQVINFMGDNQEVLTPHTKPGQWNDPDMILIGNFNLAPGHRRIQMAVWSILPAPLLMSNDLRVLDALSKEILLNSKVIAVNQDAMGLPGKRIYKKDLLEVWKRPVLPSYKEQHSYALLFLNKQTNKKIVLLTLTLKQFGMNSSKGYLVKELFTGKDYGILKGGDSFKIKVHPFDVVMLKCEVINTLR